MSEFEEFDFKTSYEAQHFNRKIQSNNTSGYKGVSWDKSKNKWRAKIDANGKTKKLGRFKTKEDAARAYNQAAMELHGEYALLNKISDTEACAN